ncbi:unnamed protein product [Paramecium octaurelia]|uniref:Uncharacterized protein n=1 Tax=Paramecium octaurelia TaxID=43137 RepID=A0A8S1YLQ2_PAROT|nr:unnamed protein product [Paramecium octaurelia]
MKDTSLFYFLILIQKTSYKQRIWISLQSQQIAV